MNAELLVGAIMLLLTAGYAWTAVALGPAFVSGQPAASFWPLVVAAIGFIASSTIIGRAYRKRDITASKSRLRPGRNMLIATGTAACYIFLLRPLGFWISTFMLCFMLTFVFEGQMERRSRRQLLAFSAVAGLVMAGAGFLLFEVLLGVRLPDALVG